VVGGLRCAALRERGEHAVGVAVGVVGERGGGLGGERGVAPPVT